MATYAETLRELQALLDAKDRRIAELEAALAEIMTIRGNVYLSGADMAIQMDKVAFAALKRETPV